MFRTAFLAALALLALASIAEAQPQVCAGADVMRPCSTSGNFLAGVKSIEVRMHRVHRPRVAAIAGRPPACAGIAWCGCWLRLHLGIEARGLNLNRAIEWRRVGIAAAGAGAGVIAVWPHHVGLVRAVAGNRILLLSGNDGHAVRERWRPIRGVVAWRVP